MKPEFVDDLADLARSIRLFDSQISANLPKLRERSFQYFVHLAYEGHDIFAPSKACAIKDINLEKYLNGLSDTTGGGDTQKHILMLFRNHFSGKPIKWKSINDINSNVLKSFEAWLRNLKLEKNTIASVKMLSVPSEYAPSSKPTEQKPSRQKGQLHPQELLKQLADQEKIGKVGEVIALRHEIARLEKLGAANAQSFVRHVSLENVAAGFDLESNYLNESRFIEVKATETIGSDFCVSQNEIVTLQEKGVNGFLYLVHVTSIEKTQGKVTMEIADPFAKQESVIERTPVLFRARLNRKKKD